MAIHIGIQVYTVRDHAEKDLEGTLAALAQAGYEGVQFAGYYGYSPEQLEAMLSRCGLKAAGTHVGLEALTGSVPEQIRYAKALGIPDITIAGTSRHPINRPEVTDEVAGIQKQLAAAGLGLSYHNHYHEFETSGGAYPLDDFFRTLPEVGMELDTYWCAYAGVNPLDYMRLNAGRLRHIHIKDMKEKPDERRVNANIGEGILPVADFLAAAQKQGVEWAFVEMDRTDGDSLECAAVSRRNLRAMGY